MMTPLFIQGDAMTARKTALIPFVLCAGASLGAQAEDVQRLETVEATAPAEAMAPGVTRVVPAAEATAPQVDTSALLDKVPGAAVVRNGSLTGIAQLRGLFNERVRVEVDGMTLTPACPNHMDPPLHYSTPAELDSMVVLPGITPVSAGGDSIAGTIKVQSIDPEFFLEGEPRLRGELGAGINGMNEGRNVAARVETGSDSMVLGVNGSWADANDTGFPDGNIADTGYKTVRGAVRVDGRIGDGRGTVELGAHRTDDAGTPTLPMDMVKDNADRVRVAYKGSHGAYAVDASAYWHDIDHLMDNYSLRPVMMMGMMGPMEAPSNSTDTGAALSTAHSAWGGTLRAGADWHNNDQDVTQRMVTSGAKQDTFRDATRQRIGLFLEWEQPAGAGWQGQYGVRVDRVDSDTDDIRNNFMPTNADRDYFNAFDHDKTDTLIDATAQWRYTVSDQLAYHFGVARKSRAPSLLERYLWTPLSASAGQADGRTYLGNQELDPEVSHQVSLGVDLRQGGFEFRPSVFYNRVKDYIQGMPIARLDTAGNPVLQYDNLEAELYGADGSWRWTATSSLTLGGTVSYVRGENRDTNDNLYRIAPLNGEVFGELRQGRWTHRAEVRAAARQDDEQETDQWAIVNLRTQWTQSSWQVRAGVENLFDLSYNDHLAGINRVMDSDVAVGEAIPAPGRFAYAEFKYLW